MSIWTWRNGCKRDKPFAWNALCSIKPIESSANPVDEMHPLVFTANNDISNYDGFSGAACSPVTNYRELRLDMVVNSN